MRCIEVAGELESRCVRVYGGSYFEDREEEAREEKKKILVESLHKMGRKAEAHNVVLVVETHFNTLTCTARETSEIVRKVDHQSVKVLYDQPNLGFCLAEDYEEALKLLDGIIGMVHVKDFVFKQNRNKNFKASFVFRVKDSERNVKSTIPGEGVLPWPRIIKSLRKRHYDRYLSLEYERRWHPDDLPPAAQGMKKGLAYLRSLLRV